MKRQKIKWSHGQEHFHMPHDSLTRSSQCYCVIGQHPMVFDIVESALWPFVAAFFFCKISIDFPPSVADSHHKRLQGWFACTEHIWTTLPSPPTNSHIAALLALYFSSTSSACATFENGHECQMRFEDANIRSFSLLFVIHRFIHPQGSPLEWSWIA